MIEIFARLRRLLMKHQIVPSNVKITIEFLDPETQARAEFAFRSAGYADTMQIMSPNDMMGVVNGNPFQVMGINFQVKRFEYPIRPPIYRKPEDCDCPGPYCQRRQR